jgi:AbiV family abortive infection protein
MVTAQSLIRGAVYSLQQCGSLLCDARLLYENGSYATAVAVAVFAREELGRWNLLLALRKRVLEGKSLTVEKVKKACDNHVDKQKAGLGGLALRGNNRAGVGKLAQSRMEAPSGSMERNEADQQFDKIYQRALKRAPDERHGLRMKALYVDILSEEQWNQPAREISQFAAFEFLIDAIGAYEVQRQRVLYSELPFVESSDHELHESSDRELHDALVRWENRPELLRVEDPSYPRT